MIHVQTGTRYVQRNDADRLLIIIKDVHTVETGGSKALDDVGEVCCEAHAHNGRTRIGLKSS